jgi:hypothetical protein
MESLATLGVGALAAVVIAGGMGLVLLGDWLDRLDRQARPAA